MTAAIVLEDGTGVAGANCYVTVAEADAYWGARNNFDWSAADKEASLIKGTSYIDTRYRGRWGGAKTNGRDQSLAWPRDGAVDEDGTDVADDEIPAELKEAVFIAALIASAGSLDLGQTTATAARVVSEQVGQLKVVYDNSVDKTGLLFTDYLDDLLRGILSGGGGGAVTFLMRG